MSAVQTGNGHAGKGETELAGSFERFYALVLRWPRASLALLALMLWLPTAATLPPMDRDESRFAQSSKQMLESRDFVDIRFGTEPRYNKPVGIYWVQAAATEIAGFGHRDRIWTYRIASLLGGIAAAWLTFWCMSAFAPDRTAFAGAALLASTLLLSAESSIATTDALNLACTLGMQGLLLRAYLARRQGDSRALPLWLCLAGWASLGASILVKGPVGIGVCAVTALALSLWDRDARWLSGTRPMFGILFAAAVVAPWAIAIALQSHGAFYQQSLGHDFAAKLARGQESHGALPGYYLALVTLTFWPATLFMIPALRSAVEARAEPAVRFLLAWATGSWLLFEAVPTKLPHYILPAYPALAMLCALFIGAKRIEIRTQSGWAIAGLVQHALGFLVLVAALVLLPSRYGQAPGMAVLVLGVLAAAATAFALARAWQGQRPRAAAGCIIASLALYAALAADVPSVSALWVSPRLAALVAEASRPGDPPVISAGFVEPSLVFLLGTGTRLADEGGKAAALVSLRGGLVLVEARDRTAFMAALRNARASIEEQGEVKGLNYSRGRAVDVVLYRVTPGPSSKTD